MQTHMSVFLIPPRKRRRFLTYLYRDDAYPPGIRMPEQRLSILFNYLCKIKISLRFSLANLLATHKMARPSAINQRRRREDTVAQKIRLLRAAVVNL
jgi:hypothetical protein